MLQIQNIVKAYGRIRALDGVSFELAPHRVTGFVGANGAGKSTLFRILAGLEPPTSGNAFLEGVSLVDYPERVIDRIGYLADHPATDRYTTVFDALDTAARLRGLSGAALKAAREEQIEFTGIGDLLQRPLTGLSCGQLQRAALARVLVGKPEILLLDEPAAGLDPRARIDLYRILKQLRLQGRTILISSHILSELDEICEDLVIIDRGKIVRRGPLAENGPAATVLLTFRGAAADFRETVSALPQVTAVEIAAPAKLRVTATDPEAVPALLERLFHDRLPIAATETETSDIADLYLKATEEKK